MNMEDSLRSWLSGACREIWPIDGDDVPSDNDMVHQLGRYIFTLPLDASPSDVFEEMSSHLGCEVCNFLERSSTFLMEACLICAVSSLSADRTRFVQTIMRLETSAKANIMESLKNNLQHYFDPDQSSDDGERGAISRDDIGDSQVVKADSSMGIAGSSNINEVGGHQSDICAQSDGVLMNSVCIQCTVNEKKRILLMQDLESVLRREGEAEVKLRAEITSQTNKLIDAEIMIIDLDEKLSNKCCELESALANNQENEIKILGHAKISNLVQSLQDKIDVLQPKADRADASESQLEKMRTRLDELKGVKLQLKAESAAHTITNSRLVESDQELVSLRKLKAQVEEYRGQCAESAIQIEELSSRLKQRDSEIRRFEKECDQLRGGQVDQRLEAQHLSDELRAANQQLINDRLPCDGVGLGMSEMNPALMNELHKLRTDNQYLLGKIDATSVDALDLLESQMADQKCINASLQEKWMTAKDSLAHTLNVVTTLRSQLETLRSDHAYFKLLTSETHGMMREENSSIRYESDVKLLTMMTTYDENINVLTINHKAAIDYISNKLSETEEELASKLEELEKIKNEKEGIMVDLSFSEQEIAEMKLLRIMDLQNSKLAEENFLHEKKREIESLLEDGQERMQLLIEHNEVNLTTEIERARDAASELDAERIKRRRVEREKKFFEAETQRLKTLLTVSSGGGASGQDIEEALKEMKSMQILLDEANSEIQALRSQGYPEGTGYQSGHASAAGTVDSGVRAGTGVRGGAVRPLKSKGGDSTLSGSGTSISGVGQMSGTYGGYLEQSEVNDKKVDQLTREKRDLLSKNLEENKERIEISQKLMASEREVRSLKAKVTKLTLEKERTNRIAANLAASGDCGSLLKKRGPALDRCDRENIENC